MNASGECVEKFAKFYKIEAKDIITIFDDIDIETPENVFMKKQQEQIIHRSVDEMDEICKKSRPQNQ